MNEETIDTQNPSPAGEASAQPDATRAPVTKKKRAKAAAQAAAAAAVEARIGHKFSDPELLATESR